jgi:hypothetical protein
VAATDDLKYVAPGSGGLASHAAIVSYDDANDLAHVTQALLWAGAGAVKVTTQGGETLVLPSMGAGTILPLRVTRVWAASTTVGAGNLIALW